MSNESLFGNSRYAINNIYAILLSGVHLWVRNASITTRDPRNSSLTNVHHWVHTNTRNNGNGGLTERPFIDKLTKLTFQHLLARPATSRVMRFNKTGTWYSEGKTVGPKLRELHSCAPGKRRPGQGIMQPRAHLFYHPRTYLLKVETNEGWCTCSVQDADKAAVRHGPSQP